MNLMFNPRAMLCHLTSDGRSLVERAHKRRGLLPRHCVHHQQRVRRLDGLLRRRQLPHQFVVDLQPPRRVHDDCVETFL